MPSLADIEKQVSEASLPPIHLWQPTHEGVMDMVIRHDGTWWHEGGEIKRDSLVRLFSTILRREADGSYCLVTPAEKLLISVDLAPFIATSMACFKSGVEQVVTFETNVGDRVIADREHPVYVEFDDARNPLPFVMVRHNLPALLSRSVYYQLVDIGTEHHEDYGIWSSGVFHTLGSLNDE
ncbi:MAG: DUF1285 domain-containing protein [Granulosicoccus sp.]|nr:DUF1285 domain-containing protein [Granulosicoccus sp.]